MMKHYSSVWFGLFLGIGLLLALCLPLGAQTANLDRSTEIPLSALRLNPQQLIASLNEGNVAAVIQQLEEGWRQQLNEYYRRFIRSEILSSEQIAQQLRENEQVTGQQSALIYAVATEPQLEVILLLPNGDLLHHRVPEATAEAIAETIRQFQMGLVRVTVPQPTYLPAAQQLYQWIIEPLRPALTEQGVENLIFCLGDRLRGVPMAALHSGEEFLVEQYSVAIIPAFNLLDPQPSNLADAEVLAMGAAEFQLQEPLPVVPVELAAINQLWQGEVSLNQEFTLENLREQRSRQPFSIVHLATHADFAPGSVQNSYIQFWDQRLWLNQLRQMDLQMPPVELLVLSACRTAVGDPNAELGFAGLAVQSGAKSALASLWAVPDVGTFLFMVGFYHNLQTAATKGEALRQTQLAILRGDLTLNSETVQQVVAGHPIPPAIANQLRVDFSHPYYWAGFTMIGNPW